ncbi:MAG: penicillin acylase family protein, partial [Burkholderiales bacterium]|nr:penicillin acylase family protein [Burkholderiales bacterium]
ATAPDWLGLGSGENDNLMASLDASTSNVGSNNWAVAGTRSEHGAILANDMHLGLRLPHIWYRMALQYGDAEGKSRRLAGVTLPGVPVLVAGSNGHVAWGFTNSYGDYMDLVELQRDPKDPTRYKTATGWETVQQFSERLYVKGATPETLTVEETPLGPIRQFGKKTYAIHWVASENGAVNTNLLGLETADDLASLQAAANRTGIPAQNIVAADSAGHIGWTIAGPLPDRRWQAAASYPYAATDTSLGWTHMRAPASYPRLVDPPAGQLWTANARQLAGKDYDLLGDGGADLGARARQIRDDLAKLGKTDEKALFQIGLDDRALFMAPWRDRALKALDDAAVAGHPQRAEFRHLLRDSWDGHASVGSVGYRLAHAYVNAMYRELFGRLDDRMEKEMGAPLTFRWANSRWEYVLGRLDDAQPAAWVPKGLQDWHALELAAIDDAAAELTKNGQPLSAASWGQRNTARIGHPFGHITPLLSKWLSAPADQLPGDDNMPRVASPDFGQSERMVVAPGHEELGLFDMPGGESGHPLSPYFLAGHEAWVHGDSLPLLPGPAQHTLTLHPAS